MHRLVEFAQRSHLTIRLAYYPPYQSKYNALERCWGILAQHCNGALLDSVDAVIKSARTMTWKGKHPVVALVTPTSQTGVKLTKAAMKLVESQLERLPHLEKWFVDIKRPSPASWDSSYCLNPSAKWHELSVPFLLVLAVSLVAAMTLVPSWLSPLSISPQSLILLSYPCANHIHLGLYRINGGGAIIKACMKPWDCDGIVKKRGSFVITL